MSPSANHKRALLGHGLQAAPSEIKGGSSPVIVTPITACSIDIYKGGRTSSCSSQQRNKTYTPCSSGARDKWGFKISTEKTVAVLFCLTETGSGYQVGYQQKGRLRQRNRLVFDQRLTWNEYIDYVSPASAANG